MVSLRVAMRAALVRHLVVADLRSRGPMTCAEHVDQTLTGFDNVRSGRGTDEAPPTISGAKRSLAALGMTPSLGDTAFLIDRTNFRTGTLAHGRARWQRTALSLSCLPSSALGLSRLPLG